MDVNRGDSVDPNCRSRLVGREFNVERDDMLYAATPPLEALRVVLSNAATWRNDGQPGRRAVMINDVRRAYLYAKATKVLYVQIPEEDPDYEPGKLGRLKLCHYGTRDGPRAGKRH